MSPSPKKLGPGYSSFTAKRSPKLTRQTFNFAHGIDAFGAFFSGVQTNFFADTVTFSDGTSQSLLIPGAGTTSSVGALSFVGFTDFGQSITSITINAGSNSTGFDLPVLWPVVALALKF